MTSSRPFLVHVGQLRTAVGTRCQAGASGCHRRSRLLRERGARGRVAGGRRRARVGARRGLGVGHVTRPWTGKCRRCLAPASGPLEVPVRELYTEDGDGEETYPLVGDEMDLEPLVRDAVLLELPLAPLCRPDCLGLCPFCGVNRNEEACSCEAPTDPRWVRSTSCACPRGESRASRRVRRAPASGPGRRRRPPQHLSRTDVGRHLGPPGNLNRPDPR